MSTIEFDPQMPPEPVVSAPTDFHSWLAGTAPKYQRRTCSCGCQDKPKEALPSPTPEAQAR